LDLEKVLDYSERPGRSKICGNVKPVKLFLQMKPFLVSQNATNWKCLCAFAQSISPPSVHLNLLAKTSIFLRQPLDCRQVCRKDVVDLLRLEMKLANHIHMKVSDRLLHIVAEIIDFVPHNVLNFTLLRHNASTIC
jgi:hypothetical protein